MIITQCMPADISTQKVELHSTPNRIISNTRKHTQHNTKNNLQYITMYATHTSSKGLLLHFR